MKYYFSIMAVLLSINSLCATQMTSLQPANNVQPMHGAQMYKLTPAKPAMHGLEPVANKMSSLVPAKYCQHIAGTTVKYCTNNMMKNLTVVSRVKYNADRTGLLTDKTSNELVREYPLAARIKITNAPIEQLYGGVGDIITQQSKIKTLIVPFKVDFQNVQTGKIVHLQMAVVGRERRIIADIGVLQASDCAIYTFAHSQYIQKANCNGGVTTQSKKGQMATQLQYIYLTPYPTTEALKLGSGDYKLLSVIKIPAINRQDITVNGRAYVLPAQTATTINISNLQLSVEKLEQLTIVGNNSSGGNNSITLKPDLSVDKSSNKANYSNHSQQLLLAFKTNFFKHDSVKFTLGCQQHINYQGSPHCTLNNTDTRETPSYRKGAKGRTQVPLQVFLQPSSKSGFAMRLAPQALVLGAPLFLPISTQAEKDGYRYAYEKVDVIAPDLATAHSGHWKGLITITATADF